MSLKKARNIFANKGVSIPTSTNATVQAWLNKIGVDGYTYPTQAQVDIYTTAWDYADAQGLTTQFDLVGLTKVGIDAASQANLIKIPFIHSAGVAARFTVNNPVDLLFRPTLGISNDNNGNANGYIDTNFNPSTQAVKATLNNTSFGGFIYNAVTEQNDINTAFIGTQKTTAPTGATLIVNVSTTVNVRINTTQTSLNFATSANDRFISAVRTSSTNTTTFLNGAQVATNNAKASSNVPNSNFYILSSSLNGAFVDNSGFLTGATAFFYYGSGAIDQAKLNTFVNLLLL